MIGILDYGMGNLQSVRNALEFIGIDSTVVKSSDAIKNCTHLIVPGVGSFNKAMSNLDASNLITSLFDYVNSGKPYLGICLGMQLLATTGYEHGVTAGLNIIPGEVKRFSLDDSCYNIPHVGWNEISYPENLIKHPVFKNIKEYIDFYFVHSYHYIASVSDHVVASTNYGYNFASVIAKENVIGVQFHPEKSQDNGLKLLENFCDL